MEFCKFSFLVIGGETGLGIWTDCLGETRNWDHWYKYKRTKLATEKYKERYIANKQRFGDSRASVTSPR